MRKVVFAGLVWAVFLLARGTPPDTVVAQGTKDSKNPVAGAAAGVIEADHARVDKLVN